ncbi:pyridine nucleotide-disulphide oxidoreductase family protein (plasmid) [Sinorhizobium fredii HH103]|uniref:Pyridine nucleotide-disulphide oxidoreductase family protein n=1 Tax=Sinorhizobium fredii (strain HH103) TaxID=1117943 RepID=G9AIF9_SINF1|nr:FAD-dependent oxidoreductase [Sinorhizobium fredii]CCF00841.1 pyridine nucleotide-disulphide oxidoreductase family protein [Sinorhizobium fredii HH103]
MRHVVIIGAGQAGSALAAKLRELGFDGRVTLIGDEPHPPYQRPPLSKAYLTGKLAADRLALRGPSFYAERGIELRLATTVTRIVPAEKRIELGAESLAYDDLVLATGAAPIPLPEKIGGALANIFTLRTIRDVEAITPHTASGKRALIVGGGYIGLEVAAALNQAGIDVTLVELQDRILGRVAAAETSAYFRSLHAERGVSLLEGVGLVSLEGDDRVRRARLSDGSCIDVDFVIVGIGVRPSVALAEAAGLAVENGVCVDAQGRTSETGIWAAGDCASFLWDGRRLRIESVPHAIDQAETVAANIFGANRDYRPRPWFWSDQFDVKLQIAGLNSGYDRIVERKGAKPGSCSYWYFAGEKLLAVDAINDARAYMTAKKLIDAGRSPSPLDVADGVFT